MGTLTRACGARVGRSGPTASAASARTEAVALAALAVASALGVASEKHGDRHFSRGRRGFPPSEEVTPAR